MSPQTAPCGKKPVNFVHGKGGRIRTRERSTMNRPSQLPRPYCTNPFVSRMNAVSRFTGSSVNFVIRNPWLISTLGMSV